MNMINASCKAHKVYFIYYMQSNVYHITLYIYHYICYIIYVLYVIHNCIFYSTQSNILQHILYIQVCTHMYNTYANAYIVHMCML